MIREPELKSDEYFEWLYSSKMRIKRRVLRMERMAANSLFSLIKNSESLYDQRFESDLEFLLTWKLSTDIYPELMWSDGVKLQEINLIKRNIVTLKALVEIGPQEKDELIEVPMEGTMVLKATGKQFKSYNFNINYKGSEIEVKKI